MYSFVSKIAVEVNRAEELVDTMPMLGFINNFFKYLDLIVILIKFQ